VLLFSCNFYLYSIIVFVFARVLVLVVFLFCISYVTDTDLWLEDFNKLTYLSLPFLQSCESVILLIHFTLMCRLPLFLTELIIMHCWWSNELNV